MVRSPADSVDAIASGEHPRGDPLAARLLSAVGLATSATTVVRRRPRAETARSYKGVSCPRLLVARRALIVCERFGALRMAFPPMSPALGASILERGRLKGTQRPKPM